MLQPEKVRTPEAAATLAALDADLFVVVAYGRILPQALLDLPRLGAYNVHASLLPKWRGAAPIQWAIIGGETETGVSIMRMEAGLDTGPVAATRRLPIGDGRHDRDPVGQAGRAGRGAARRHAARDRSAVASRLTAQDHAAATVARLLTKADGLLDFDQPARLVSAQARGVDPWPGATALLDGEPLRLFGPRVLPPAPAFGRPGEVMGLDDGMLAVACGDAQGARIGFAELQLPGRRRLPAAAVLAGRPIPAGTRLGAP